MGVMLSQPVELIRVQRGGSTAFRSAVGEMQGWRSSHEDAHAMSCGNKLGSFWVLDGHGGDAAANFCAPELGKVFRRPEDDEAVIPRDSEFDAAFRQIDVAFRNRVEADDSEESGSTIVGSVITKQLNGTYSLKLANCGDSRGVVVQSPLTESSEREQPLVTAPSHLATSFKNETRFPVVLATVDHKPNHPTEQARIEKRGGMVSQDEPPRLDGNLAVSRGFGDYEYKKDAGVDAADQKVSCVPDIYEVSGLTPGSICVLACDGLWDVMSSQEVAEFVRVWLTREPGVDLGQICTDLIRKSLELNSRDNVTVMIIHLVDGSDWAASSKRFNSSDEMKNFDSLLSFTEQDDDVRTQYTQFLRRCEFPPKPVVCHVSGRWFHDMFKCPGTGKLYSTKSCQKIGWKQFKAGLLENCDDDEVGDT